MVKITMDQVINFGNNVDFFSNTNLPLKGAYKLNKIKKALEKENEFYAEKFQEILNTYAKKDDEGNFIFNDDGSQIIIKEEMIEDCNKALEDLHTLEVEVDTYGLKIDDLGDNFECTPDQLEALMPFME